MSDITNRLKDADKAVNAIELFGEIRDFNEKVQAGEATVADTEHLMRRGLEDLLDGWTDKIPGPLDDYIIENVLGAYIKVTDFAAHPRNDEEWQEERNRAEALIDLSGYLQEILDGFGLTTPGGTDGSDTDGSDTDGSGTDGSGTDGSGTDGSGTDGSGTDGSGTDGSGTDGSGADADDSGPGNEGAGSSDDLPPPPPPPAPPPTPASPLALDLDGDGVETVGLSKNIYFDHDGDSFRELTGAIASDDGLLTLDLNGDGQVNSGAELFGNSTRLPDGNLADNGFLALEALDTNSDGMVNGDDERYADLRIWRDLDQDGETDNGELFDLNSVGVNSLLTA